MTMAPTPPLSPKATPTPTLARPPLGRRQSSLHPYQLTHNVRLHPDFSDTGDVLILCRDGQSEVGFKVHSDVLRASR
jgi:hypothetical protein